MNEADMTQVFTESLRLYAERLRNNGTLGPFKGLLTNNYVTVKVQLDVPLSITVVEEPKKEEPTTTTTETISSKWRKREKLQNEDINP